MRAPTFIEKVHQTGDDHVNLDGFIMRNNWEPLKQLCAITKDGVVVVPAPEILTISWTNTPTWSLVTCQTFLQHFAEASSLKIVIDPGNYVSG